MISAPKLNGLGQRGCSKGTVILLRVVPLRSTISCPDSTMWSGLSVRRKVLSDLALMLDSEVAKEGMSNGDDFCLENRRIDGESIWWNYKHSIGPIRWLMTPS